MEKEKKRNRGFSLIELIIVIAIMAILVSVMTPLLIRYIEKTKVSSDTQLADTVLNAFLCATTDARVLSDPASEPYLTKLESDNGMNVDIDTDFQNSDCVMKESVDAILGKSLTDLIGDLRSAHASDTHIKVKSENGKLTVTITGTDSTGKKDTSNSTPENDIVVG